MIWALLGGLLIGLAVTLMLTFNGRVTGISGIVNGLLSYQRGDMAWRVFFIAGLISGGLFLSILFPETLENTLEMPLSQIGLAGFIVGFGTVLGSGCTSGHGVCGISRLSLRSILATLTFIALGAGTVLVSRHFVGF